MLNLKLKNIKLQGVFYNDFDFVYDLNLNEEKKMASIRNRA